MLLGFGGILHPEASFLLEPFYPNLKAHTNICKKAACSKRFHILFLSASNLFSTNTTKHLHFFWFPLVYPTRAAARRQVWSDGHDRARAKCPASGLAPLTSGRPGHGSMEGGNRSQKSGMVVDIS